MVKTFILVLVLHEKLDAHRIIYNEIKPVGLCFAAKARFFYEARIKLTVFFARLYYTNTTRTLTEMVGIFKAD